MKALLLPLLLLPALTTSVPAAENALFYALDLDPLGGKRLDSYGQDRSWSAVPLEVQEFAGVPFYLTSKVQFQGTGDAQADRFYPSRATGLRVQQRAARLHALHAANLTDSAGRPIAALRLNYADGHAHLLVLRYGVHTRDWWQRRTEPDSSFSDTNSKVVWTGRSSEGDGQQSTHRLIKTTFELPVRAAAIETIDVFSLFGRSSYVLFGLTLEAPGADAVVTTNAPPSVALDSLLDSVLVAVRAADGRPLSGARIEPVVVNNFGVATPLGRPTDTTQRPGFVTVDYPAGARSLRLAVSARNLGPMGLELKPGADGRLPRQAAIELAEGESISGTVLTSDGRPLARAKVLVADRRRGATGADADIILQEVTSDAQGHWRAQVVAAAVSNLVLKVIHSSYLAHNFDVSETPGGNHVTLDSLRAGEAALRLKPTLEVSGKLMDPSGQPLPQTQISLRHGETLGSSTGTRTDSQGRFKFSRLAPGDVILYAQVPGFAPFHEEISLSDHFETIDVTLKPPRPLRARVFEFRPPETTELKPLAGAMVTVQSTIRAGSALFRYSGPTDANGRVVWEQAPSGPLRVEVRHSTYKPRMFQVVADTNELEFALSKTFDSWGTVVDAVTQQPVAQFTVTPGMKQQGRNYWRSSQVTTGQAGDYALHDPQGGLSLDRSVVKIEASGYHPQLLTAEAAAWRSNHIALRPGTGPKGRVKSPDGRPASGAQIAVLGEEYIYLNLAEGQTPSLFGGRAALPTSGPEGEFQLMPHLGERVVIAHADGWADTTSSNLARNGDVTLQPWGRIEGRLLRGTNPVADAQISLHESRSDAMLNFSLAVRSDAEGRFQFSHAPPGRCWVSRVIKTGENSSTHGDATPVLVEPGRTVVVSIGGAGRPVIGRVVADDPTRAVDWGAANRQASGGFSTTRPRPPASRTPSDYEDWAASAEGRAALDAVRSYYPQFASDGTFRVDDVLPGTYQIQLFFFEPPTAGRAATGLGSVTHAFEMPPIPGGRSDEPFNLGNVVLRTIRNVSANR